MAKSDSGNGGGNLLLAGGSGLIGQRVVERLLERDSEGLVFLPLRRDLPKRDARLVVLRENLSDPAVDPDLARSVRERIGLKPSATQRCVETFICCLGTTLKVAGSQSAFRSIDHDLVLRMASLARELGARRAIVVSSVGADPKSGSFYLRVKGDVERRLGAIGFERVDVLRPGLLLGARSESRPGERIAQSLAFLYNPFLRGPLKRFGAISAAVVADAIVSLLGKGRSGFQVHENAAIEALAK